MTVELTASDVMQTPVVTVRPGVELVEAARLLDEREVGSVVVVEDEQPVGIVTDADVVHQFVAGASPETAVRDVMQTPVVTTTVDTSISDLTRTVREERTKKLPVCDDEGCLAGIVTAVDLSYYVPTLARLREGEHARSTRLREGRTDTAYEADDWEFESFGTHDGTIDVGDSVTFSKVLNDGDVTAFADASGDTNRLHLDAEYAERTRFGRPIAHGTLVSGTISAALARLPGLIIYLSQEVAYKGPVDIGERVTAHCEVTEALGDDRYRLLTEVLDEDDEVVIEGDAVVLADELPADS